MVIITITVCVNVKTIIVKMNVSSTIRVKCHFSVALDLENMTRERDELLAKEKETGAHVPRSRRVKAGMVRNTTLRERTVPGKHIYRCH